MLTFYRTPDCPKCSYIQDALEELQIVHKVITVDDGNNVGATQPGAPELPPGTRLPLLLDEGEIFQGSDAILEHLEELQAFKVQWYKYQSDACYCDAQGNVE